MNISSKLLKPKTCLGILLFFVLLFIFWISFWRTSVRSHEDVPFNFYIEDSTRQSLPPRTILLWNKFFLDRRWTLPADTVGPSLLKSNDCPEYNCVVTNDKDYLPSVDKFDAILFHMASMSDIRYWAPRTRTPAQLYVFSMLESPLYPLIDMTKIQEIFNLTMTYRLHSDILWGYGSIEEIETGEIVAPAVKPHWRHPPAVFSDEKLEAIVGAKKKFAVWFVSHCTVQSKREELVVDLQKYVSVDVFGDCGPLVCKHSAAECDGLVNRDYKFYFSFENSLCVDYVTEKLFNALTLTVIPVVYGGADYSRFAPPHSYIDANNFTNVKELADYLIYLSANPKEYLQYFWWREYYRPRNSPVLCNLCAEMNSRYSETKVQAYSDIRSWWMNNSCYLKPRISFKTQSPKPNISKKFISFDVS